MRKYGFLKHSLVDYPGEICSVVFIPGCNFHCEYCHNKSLEASVASSGVHLREIIDFLNDAKQRFITAVCITGGEPTLYPETLQYLVTLFKGLGLKVKVDTNGSHPDQIQQLDSQVDYFAMDLKTSLPRYCELCPPSYVDKIHASIKYLLAMPSQRYEFRTTLSWQYVDEDAIRQLGQLMVPDSYWYLQKCHLTDKRLSADETVIENEKITRCLQIARSYSRHVQLRS